MKLLLKAIFLQAFWYITVLYGPYETYPLFMLLGLSIALINWFVFKPNIDGIKYILILLTFILWGFLQDLLLIKSGILVVDSFPYWMTSLWVIFLCYYGDILNKFKSFNTSLVVILGSLGGLASYVAGVKLSGVELLAGSEYVFYAIVFFSWALFFPVSIHMFYKKSFLDKLLDLSIYFSFDSSGFKRHKRFFDNSKGKDISNKNILVTGGTSGIGLSTALALKKLGANVYVTGRNTEKGKKVEKDGLNFLQLDLANWEDIKKFSNSNIVYDHIVLNAGGMPQTIQVNNQQVELQVASQLIGHYILVNHLKDLGNIEKGSRIVWVSSGGMYLKKLALNELKNNTNYDKVETYANVKRAQVTFVEELAKDKKWDDYKHFSMHPGWVDTDGIKEALPKFYKWTKNRLRTGKQGSDTITWLVTTSSTLEDGAFYFDREKVKPYFSEKYNPNQELRKELLSFINSYK